MINIQINKRIFSLQTKVILLVCCVVAIALSVTSLLISRHVNTVINSYLAKNSMNIARIVAHSPIVIEALDGERDESEIQEYANSIRNITDVLVVAVIDMNGLRRSHPEPEKLGGHILGGDEVDALQGKEYISYATGSLGYQLRAFTPVFTSTGKQVGFVVVTIMIDDVELAVGKSKEVIYLASGIGLLVGVVGAVILSRNVKKTLFGLEPYAIANLLQERSSLLEQRNAMLQSVREGVIAVDKEGVITVANDEARRVLQLAGIFEEPVGKKANQFIPNTHFNQVLKEGSAELDQEQNLNGVIILSNRVPVFVNGKIAGAIATFRDKTEVRQLAEELTGVRSYMEALRSRAHEFMNKLHVILGLVQMEAYDQVATYIEMVNNEQQEEYDFICKHIKEPVIAGFLLSKLSRAREEGVEMILDKSINLPEMLNCEMTHELVTIIGNLIDNAIEVVANCPCKQVFVLLSHTDHNLIIEVRDTGPGMDDEVKSKLFEKGFSTKGPDRGLGLYLVKLSVERLDGIMELTSAFAEGTCFKIQIPYRNEGDDID